MRDDMLTIDHKVSPSTIHGLGVFSNERIVAGQLVWRFSSVVDREVPIKDLLEMPDHVLRAFARHAWYIKERGTFIISADGDYFMNHSSKPNLIDNGQFMFAARDIEPGEELTCDYRVVTVLEYDPHTGRAHYKNIRDLCNAMFQNNKSTAIRKSGQIYDPMIVPGEGQSQRCA